MATTTISGTTDLEDNSLERRQTAPVDDVRNNGGATFFRVGRRSFGAPLVRSSLRGVFRIRTGAIPSGQIDEVRINVTETAASNGAGSGKFFTIKDGNDVWVEGTASGTNETGSSCWDTQLLSVGPVWNGGAGIGCGTAGTDYDTTDIGTFSWLDAAGLRTYTLTNVQPFTDWRSGARLNGGILWRADDEASDQKFANYNSTENAANQPTVEIDTTPFGGFNPKKFYFRNPWRLPRLDTQVEPHETVKNF
jgi:hypothetical protein